MAEVVLIAVNNDDIALPTRQYLLEMSAGNKFLKSIISSYSNQHVRMWFLLNRILWQDDLDKRGKATGRL